MKKLSTLSEILKEHKSAFFTVIRANGDEVFAHPLSAAQVHEGIDKSFLGCCVSEIAIENIFGAEFVTVTLRF